MRGGFLNRKNMVASSLAILHLGPQIGPHSVLSRRSSFGPSTLPKETSCLLDKKKLPIYKKKLLNRYEFRMRCLLFLLYISTLPLYSL